ncbi:MAG: WD40 repeat domain-containing serine/threonine protein kinase [Kofleriaceae bacterium]
MTDRGDIELDETVAPTSSQPTPQVVVRSNPPKADPQYEDDHADLRTVALEDYALGDEVARGGMGRIRKARDLRLGRPVAVKELLVRDALTPVEPAMAERFEREIRLTARLQHPSIVSVYEAGRWPTGEPFYAMRMVPGKGLDAVIKPLETLPERLALLPNMIAICEALAYAHDQRIIHRDLKPGNVLIGPFGETVVIDWGLAKDLAVGEDTAPEAVRIHGHATDEDSKPPSKPPSSDASLTLAGSVMGTPAYMPPEQAAGDPVDERADVYSLGAILYHVLAGRPPFIARRSDELLVKVLSKSPAALAEIDAEIPQDLITIVEKAMARTPAQRYASARELAADLKRFQTGQLVGAHQYSYWALLRRWVRKHRAAVSVGALALVALAATATILVRNIVRERDRAEDATAQAEAQRAAAVRARDQVVIASARLHFDQGRQELLAGNPLRAAVLVRAALDGEDTGATRLLTGLALQSLQPLARRFDGLVEPIYSVGFAQQGAQVFAATWLGKIRFWDTRTGTQTSAFERAGKLTDAGLSPDGKTLVVLGDESELELWDLASGKKRGTIAIPGGVAGRAEFSPDGRVLAVTGDALTIWSAETLKQVATGPALADDLMTVLRWTADGERVVLASASGAIQIVDGDTWKPIVTVMGNGKEVRDCAISPDGTRLAYVLPDGGSIIDARTGKHLVELDGPDEQRSNQYRGVEWSTDGSLLAITTVGENARLVEAGTGRTRRTFGDAAVVTFSPSSSMLLSYGQAPGRVALWDVASGRLVNELAGHADAIGAAMFSPDGTSVLTSSDDGTIALWTVAPNDSETRAPLHQRSRIARFSTNGDLLVTGGDDGTADVYDARTGQRLRRFGTPSDVPIDPIVELLPDGRVLTVLGNTKIVELWDLAGGARLSGFDAGAPIKRAGISADLSRVWAATHTSLVVWDAKSSATIASFPHLEPEGDPPQLLGHHAAATVTPDGTRALVPVDQGVAIIDIANKQQIGKLLVGGDIWSVVLDGDRAIVIATGATTLFDLSNNARIASLVAQGELVQDARFAEGAIYTHGTDTAIRRWDRETGGLAVTFESDADGQQLFAVQPGGGLLATFADNHARLWDVRTGKLLVARDTALDANGTATLLAFSPDGKLVASGYAGTLWTWLLPVFRGTPAALDAILRCEVPWQLVDGTLAPRPLDATCPR